MHHKGTAATTGETTRFRTRIPTTDKIRTTGPDPHARTIEVEPKVEIVDLEEKVNLDEVEEQREAGVNEVVEVVHREEEHLSRQMRHNLG